GAEVAQAEAEVALARTIERQLIDAIAEPVVVRLPMALANEVPERQFDRGEPARLAGQAVKPPEAKGGLSLVIDDPERLAGLERGKTQDMIERAVLGALHVQDAFAETIEQVAMELGAEHLCVLDEREQANAVPAEFDLAVPLDEEGHRLASGLDRPDDMFAQVPRGSLDRLAQHRVARDLESLEHRVQRARVAQVVVGTDRAVEARVPAVGEAPVRADLTSEVAAAGGNDPVEIRDPQHFHAAAPGVAPTAVQLDRRGVLVRQEQAPRAKHPDGPRRRKVNLGQAVA